jgi:hypothetical protein
MTEERLPRQWLLIARRNEGKSTFAAAMDPEHLVLDLDGRWDEQKGRTKKSYKITNSEPLRIVEEMEKMRPQLGTYVKTIVVDSGTAVLDYISSRGRLMEADAVSNKKKYNKNDDHLLKADTMRLLRFALLKWKCDYLWIFHIEDGKLNGADRERTTIPKTELERMKANLNAVMTIVKDKNGTRGIRIEWSRYNDNIAAGQIVWDTEGLWKGVPERLDDFLQSFMGNEGYNGGAYSGEWLLKFLDGKGVKFTDVHEMYVRLDVRDEPAWFDRNGWGAFVKKALPEPTK